jgi:hypothetical protein
MFLFCSKNKKQTYSPKIESINGTVKVTANNKDKFISKEYIFRSGDLINTGMNSFITVNLNDFHLIFNENTEAKIEFEQRHGNDSLLLSINLYNGSIFTKSEALDNLAIQYVLFTPTTSITGNESNFGVTYFKSKKVTVIRNFKNHVSVCPYNRDCINIAECKKILINGGGVASRILSVGIKDIDEIKTWASNDAASNVKISECINIKKKVKNLPPQWRCEPKKQTQPKELFYDTLSAFDPESMEVRYTLIKGPSKMSLSESNGILNFKPDKPGSFEIQLSAKDESGNESILTYTLIVLGKLNPVIKIPDFVNTEEVFTIDGSKSVNKNGGKTGLKYRFDFTNDGIWDYPSSGDFGEKPNKQHSFLTSGVYKIKLQIKDENNDTAETIKPINVMQSIESRITCSPQYGTVGTKYTLTIVNNSGIQDFRENTKFRWDFTSDGIWDYPDDGTYSDDFSISHIWDNYGTYEITVNSIYNNQVNTVTKTVEVFKGISIETLQGPDTVNVNENIHYTCIAKDPDFKIVEYSWDFAGVGFSNEISESNSVDFSYKKEGRHTLACNVRNEKGMSVSESKYIYVRNFSTVVDAGGPYNTFVNKPVNVEGYYRDVDNKVISFLWDFDNDKKFEWDSHEESKANHAFSHEGIHIIRFGVKTDDNKITEDTATVHVINRPPTALSEGKIIAKKNKMVSLNGMGNDPDNNIVRYEWDFDCDGIYDWSSSDTGFTETKFSEYSRAVFRVTDSDSASSIDTLSVVICPDGMKLIPEGKFCMDIYEWPNEKKKIPVRNITYEESKIECSKIGKRLCTQNEMIAACQGNKDNYLYPYGKKYNDDYCNTYGNRHVDNSIAPSGEFPECVSRYGIYDMSGNISEWTSTQDGDLVRAVGGWWQNGNKRSTCKSYIPLEKNKKYIHVGFRCCK